MSAPEVDIEWMEGQTHRLIGAAIDGASGVEVFREVNERYGTHGIYCVCAALAEVVAKLGGYERAPGYAWAFSVGDSQSGRVLNPDAVAGENEEMAALVSAYRFVIAVLNRDADQSIALFCAPRTDDEAVAIPAGLVALVRLFGQRKLAELGRG